MPTAPKDLALTYQLCVELGQTRLALAIEDQKRINHYGRIEASIAWCLLLKPDSMRQSMVGLNLGKVPLLVGVYGARSTKAKHMIARSAMPLKCSNPISSNRAHELQ